MKVKSCYKLESGLRLGQEGIHACQLGPFSSPIYFSPEEAALKPITKEDIISKRKWIFDLLNSPDAETPCKHCDMVEEKDLADVRFDQLGHIDLAATTTCNLRCDFCGYTKHDSFAEGKYDALKILEQFNKEDVVWKAAVDFNGGEPTILKDFDEHIDYFDRQRIRVFLFTNGVIYKESVFKALDRGTIRWCVVSLDAGTSQTYHRTKRSTKYIDVIENISKYSVAGRKGGGNVSVKYIFTQNNSTDDDIYGFVYAMLACKPQEIWLTFDFDPLCDMPADAPNFGGYDYSIHIEAYVKMYFLFKKHGVTPIHYAEKHLAPASLHGKELLRLVKQKISDTDFSFDERLALQSNEILKKETGETDAYKIDFVRFVENKLCFVSTSLPIESDLIFAVAPATLRCDEYVRTLKPTYNLKAIFDKDLVFRGKTVEGLPVLDYEHSGTVDAVIVKCQEEILPDILRQLTAKNPTVKIFVDISNLADPIHLNTVIPIKISK